MNYRKEFPDFDFDIPALPDGFFDTSWHNNVSPSFEHKLTDTHSVTLWVDYLNPDRRECGGSQFLVCIHLTEEMEFSEVFLETDSWDEAINAINQIFSEAKQ
jgi:hypothetical protein